MMIQEKNKREKELKRIKGTTRLGQSPLGWQPKWATFTDCLGNNHIDYTTHFLSFFFDTP